MNLSVIVPVYNGVPELAEQLDALAAQTYPGSWELVLADNGSTDGTRALAEARAHQFDEFRFVDASDRRGASHARNVGASFASGDYLIFIDADDRAAPDWLATMATAAPGADAIGGRTQRFYTDRRGAEHFMQHPSAPLRSLDARYLPFAPAGNCGIRSELFRELGGFDEAYVVCEDAEFFWRLQRAGHTLVGVPDSLVFTRDRRSARAWFRQQYAWGRGQVRLYEAFAEAGLSGRTPRQAFGAVGSTLLRTPTSMRTHYGRRAWLGQLAITYGRLRESAQRGVRYF